MGKNHASQYANFGSLHNMSNSQSMGLSDILPKGFKSFGSRPRI